MKVTVSIFAFLVLIGGVILFTKGDKSIHNNAPANNVSVVDGKQIIEVSAKGGYTPRKSIAKAGLPTILRFNTSGTFDCSSSVRISSMNITNTLPQTGSTDIDLGNPQLGILQGTCGMGMYPFEIEFKS